MIRKALFASTLLFVPLIVPSPASAQARRFELTPSVGYRFVGDVDVQRRSGFFNNNVDVDEGDSYGIFFDVPLSSSLQLELIGNRQQTKFVQKGDLLTPTVDLADVDITYLQAGILFQGGEGQVNPFVSATLGGTRLDVKQPLLNDETRFSATLGAGVKVFVSENIGFRFEGRAYWTDLGSGDRDRRDYNYDNALYQYDVSAGLILAW